MTKEFTKFLKKILYTKNKNNKNNKSQYVQKTLES